jgi:energy-coupling factor transporter transmembrane protein EcfT
MSQRVRCVLVLAGLTYVLTSANSLGHLLLCVALAPVIARTASGRRALSKRLRSLVPLMLGLALSLLIVAALSGWLLSMERAYAIGTRVLAATLLLTWLTHDLTAIQLEHALRSLRLPEAFVALVLETHAFAAQLSETLQAAWAACALRGGLGSLRALRQTIGAVAGVVILRAIDRSERVAVANALRGVGAQKSEKT